MQTMHYSRLLTMTALHFVAMYALMYAMVNVVGNVYHHLNQLYMAGLMTAAMVLVELPVMKAMYPVKRYNRAIIAAGLVALIACFVMIRQQTAIGDTQFLRSMIPHHASAILMCRRAPITDSEIERLCVDIIASQQREIDQMKAILDRLGR